MKITPEHVQKAYSALATGDKLIIQDYWTDDMAWLVPGHNILSGWKNNLDEFLTFMAKVGELSDRSFQMRHSAILTRNDYSADISRNTGHRAGDEKKLLDIDVVHIIHWRNGKVVEGKGAIFGNGTAEYDNFWSPV